MSAEDPVAPIENLEDTGFPPAPNLADNAELNSAHLRSRRRWRSFGRSVGFLTCLTSMAFGTVIGHFYWGSRTLRDLLSGHFWSTGINIMVHGDPLADWVPEKTFIDRKSMNILVLGADREYDEHDKLLNTPGRSDAILMLRVDFEKKTIDGLTIPRDSAVHLPDFNNIHYPGIHKINSAYHYGGADLTCATLKSVFSLDTDAYVALDLEAFMKIVDALGGIDLTVEKKLDYDDNCGKLHIHLKPGLQHLDGYQAMGYVRIRHQDSDAMRSRRQRNFIEAMRSKVKLPSTFMALPRVIETLSDNIKHPKLTRDQLFTLINFARGLPKENIKIVTLPSEEGRSFVRINADKSADIIKKLFFPGQEIALSVVAPDGYRVDSLNAGSTRQKPKKTKNTPKGEKSNVETPLPSPLDPPINDTAPGDNNSPMPGESKDPAQSPIPDLGTTGKAGMNG